MYEVGLCKVVARCALPHKRRAQRVCKTQEGTAGVLCCMEGEPWLTKENFSHMIATEKGPSRVKILRMKILQHLHQRGVGGPTLNSSAAACWGMQRPLVLDCKDWCTACAHPWILSHCSLMGEEQLNGATAIPFMVHVSATEFKNPFSMMKSKCI